MVSNRTAEHARNPSMNAINAVNMDLPCDSADRVVARISLSRFSFLNGSMPSREGGQQPGSVAGYNL